MYKELLFRKKYMSNIANGDDEQMRSILNGINLQYMTKKL